MTAGRSKQPKPRSESCPSGTWKSRCYSPAISFTSLPFHELSTTRAIGAGLGPIPWDKILSYAEIAGLDEDLRVDFQQVIRVLDNAYLKWSADTAKPSAVR